MKQSNNNLLLFVIVILLVVFGVYHAWNRTYDSKKDDGDSKSYVKPNQMKKRGEDSPPDIEFVAPSDDGTPDDDSAFQLLGVANEEPAFQIGFGMGPGLYGSGRHTSEMIGN